jgi:FixJ family two-component response regulator
MRNDRGGKMETTNNSKKVDWVIIDDNQMFADSLASFFEGKSLSADKYYNPKRFLANLEKYEKDTKICFDNYFGGNQITGLDLARQLYAAGYTKLYLLSGNDFEKEKVPNYIMVLVKGDIDITDKLLAQ